MNIQSRYATLNYNNEVNTVRLDRTYRFATSEDSENFAEKLGTVMRFPGISVFVDPIFGEPEASVSIECKDDSFGLAMASELLESFEDLRG